MRLYEFSGASLSTTDANLLTALEMIRNRYKDINAATSIRTQSLINMVVNTDRLFNYDALVAANAHNPAVKNLIKSFNRNVVVLQPFGDDIDTLDDNDDDTISNVEQDAMQIPLNTVSDMAKRAAKERGAKI